MTDQQITVTYGNGATQPVDVAITATESPPTQTSFGMHPVIIGYDNSGRATLMLQPGAVVPPAPPPPPPVGPVSGYPVGAEIFSGVPGDDLSVWSDVYGDGSWGELNGVECVSGNVSVGSTQTTLTLASANSGACVHTAPVAGKKGFTFTTNVYVEWDVLLPGDWSAVWTTWISGTYEEVDFAEILAGSLTSNAHLWSPSGNRSDNGPAEPASYLGTRHRFGGAIRPNQNLIYWDDVLIRTETTTDPGYMKYLIANIGIGANDPVIIGAQVILYGVKVWQLA
jgi:hypothetical protein